MSKFDDHFGRFAIKMAVPGVQSSPLPSISIRKSTVMFRSGFFFLGDFVALCTSLLQAALMFVIVVVARSGRQLILRAVYNIMSFSYSE